MLLMSTEWLGTLGMKIIQVCSLAVPSLTADVKEGDPYLGRGRQKFHLGSGKGSFHRVSKVLKAIEKSNVEHRILQILLVLLRISALGEFDLHVMGTQVATLILWWRRIYPRGIVP